MMNLESMAKLCSLFLLICRSKRTILFTVKGKLVGVIEQ